MQPLINAHERILTLFLTSCGLSPMCARGFRIRSRSLLDAPAFHAAQALPRKDPRTIFCGLFCCSSVRWNASMPGPWLQALSELRMLDRYSRALRTFVCRSTPRLAGGHFYCGTEGFQLPCKPKSARVPSVPDGFARMDECLVTAIGSSFDPMGSKANPPTPDYFHTLRILDYARCHRMHSMVWQVGI